MDLYIWCGPTFRTFFFHHQGIYNVTLPQKSDWENVNLIHYLTYIFYLLLLLFGSLWPLSGQGYILSSLSRSARITPSTRSILSIRYSSILLICWSHSLLSFMVQSLILYILHDSLILELFRGLLAFFLLFSSKCPFPLFLAVASFCLCHF